MTDNRSDEQKAKDAEKTLTALSLIRQPFEATIDEVIKFVHHARRKITEKDAQKGLKGGLDVYDGTALSALNLLADGLHGYLVAPSLRWFSLTLPGKMQFARTSGMRAWSGKRMDEYPEVKEWLDDCADVLYSAFLRSNFYDTTPEYFRDGGSIGTVTMFIEEDLSRDRIMFSVPHFRECYISENQFGSVDTNYRVFKLTLRQLVQKFGLDQMKKADPSFDLGYKNDPYSEREVLHAVYPRSDYDRSKVNGVNKPVASLWLLRSPLKLILESGYEDNPAVTWRWRKNNDEWYGRSPAWDAFVEIMLANQQGKSNLIAAQKMVEPPMIGPEDLRGKVNVSPKGWTWVEQGSPAAKGEMLPRALMENIQLPFAVDAQDRNDGKIKEHFHVDFFIMLSQMAYSKLQITATQVIEMQGEKAAILGTRIGRLQSEFLNPTIDRVFAIEERAGRIPMPPQMIMDMGGSPIEVDYLGPLAQAQKRLFMSQGIMGGIESLAPVSKLFPEALDVINPDITARELLESRGFPAKAFRSDEEVKKIRRIREERVVADKTVGQIAGLAKVLPAAGKPIETGSPLDTLIGGAAAAAGAKENAGPGIGGEA
jgi:hypothetical protein